MPHATSCLRILHVDPDPHYARIVQQSLTREGPLAVTWAEQLDTALALLARTAFDAVLVDPVEPHGDVGAHCERLRRVAGTTPLVVLTSMDDHQLAMQTLDAGAQDYLVKGQTDGVTVLRAIRFARARCQAEEADAVPRPPELAEGPPRVLVIEQDAGDACRIGDTLAESLGPRCEVVHVARLSEALEQLSRSSFHLAIVDLALPDSRGLDTCVVLRRQAPHLPLVVHSRSSDESLALKTIQHGASDYLAKSLTSGSALARSVCFALRRQRHVRPKAAMKAAGTLSDSRRDEDGHDVAVDSSGGSVPVASAPTSPARGWHGSSDSSEAWLPGVTKNRRTHDRYSLVRSVIAIPVSGGGRPDWEGRLHGVTCDLSREGIGLELDTAALTHQFLVVGVERRDGALCHAGVEVRHVQPLSPNRLRVGTRIGGRGEEILSSSSLTPSIDLNTMRIIHGGADGLLSSWGEIGVLRPMLLDWIEVCPKCRGIPTFRSGCRSCGSARIALARLIHHFACAHVGPVLDFERSDGLVCPKCRKRNLIIGADFEYQPGPSRCLDCHWSGSSLEQIAQCLRCNYRFRGSQAESLEMIGYHVHRLDPLAFITAP